MKPLAIRGLGAISVAGTSLRENWETMLRGESCIRPIINIPTESLGSDNAGQIDLDDGQLRSLLTFPVRSDTRLPMERGEILLFIALEQALVDAGIPRQDLATKRVGLFVGTSLSGFTRLEKEYQRNKKFLTHIRPSAFLTYPLHVCLERISFEYRCSGPRYLFSTACSASLHPILVASETFSRGQIDLAIIGGTDPLSLMSLAGFSALKSLAHDRSSPFSTTDLGISIGEGAGVLILDGSSSNHRYPSILGVAGTSDAYHPTASNPTGEAIRLCIEKALQSIPKSEKSYYMAHGTGTPHNDMVETRAIKQVQELATVQVSALKSVIGHTLGASGALELVMLAKAMHEKTCLPIANFSSARQGCDLDYVLEARSLEGTAIGVKSAFAFGGNNVTVALGHSDMAGPYCQTIPKPLTITGIGLVSPADVFDNPAIIEKLASGATFVKEIPPIEGFNRKVSARHAGLVDQKALDDCCNRLRMKNTRKMDRISRLSSVAAALALKDADFKVNTANASAVGLVSATGTGALESVYDFYTHMLEKGVKLADANVFPNTVVNAHLGYVSIELKIKGYTTVLTQGTTSPYAALTTARYLIETDMCQAVLVGAVTEYSPAYHRAQIDIAYVGTADGQYCYAREMQGNVVGEGAVFFLVEPESAARSRGARIHAVLDQVENDATPCFPSTYGKDSQGLSTILNRLASTGCQPGYLAGEGNGLAVDRDLELQAFRGAFPKAPLSSAASRFGMASGLMAFYNLALFALNPDTTQIPGVVHDQESTDPYLVRGAYAPGNGSSCLIASLAPGGSAGAIVARRNG